MNRTFLFVVFSIVIISLTAFQTSTADWSQRYKIMQTRNLKTGKTVDYNYTPKGQIASISGSQDPTTTFEYHGTLIIKKTFDYPGHVATADTLHLSAKGLLAERHDQQGYLSGQSETYEYSDAGYMIDSKTLEKGIPNAFSQMRYSNGNQSMLIQSIKSSQKPNVVHFTYYTDKLNTIGNDNIGMSFMGHSSRNLIKEMMAVSPRGDTVMSSFNYYFDDMGRVKTKVSYRKSALLDSIAYTYY